MDFSCSLLKVPVPSFVSGIPMEFERYVRVYRSGVIKTIPLLKPKRVKHKIKAAVNRRYFAKEQLTKDYAEYAIRRKMFMKL